MKSVVFKWTVLCAVIFGLVFASCDSVSEESDDIGNVGNSDGSQTSGNYLSESVWTDGKISKEGQTNEYRIAVSEGSRYFIYMNNAWDGDKTKTAYTGLKISFSDGTMICSQYGNADELYAKPYTFTVSRAGTVTITVASHRDYYGWEKGTGTYAIKYTSRREVDTLVEDVWQNDIIISDGQTNKYSINAVGETRYFIYMNNAWDGDKTKSAYTGLKIYFSDGTIINGDYSNITERYSAPYTFTVSNAGTITIAAAANSSSRDWSSDWEEGTGTYAIKYTSLPEYDALSEDEWKEDKIIADGQTNKYRIAVSEGSRYFIYMNNAWSGDKTKSAYTGLKISYSDGTVINGDYSNIIDHYSAPYTFVASSTGIVIITVAANEYSNSSYLYLYKGWERGTGTYAVKYTSRPGYDTLSEGEWKEDKIISNGQTNKYHLQVTSGTKYSIYVNDKNDGDGTKTASQIGLTIIYSQDSNSDNPIICNNYSNATKLYAKPYTFTAPSTGTITLAAASYRDYYGWEKGTGTYAIKYTENN
ncbi:MAG: hypothetical protein K2M50_00725 [Treponemataceae bacterium]|nr:hypothetical protein [Treponemataceae bacterium]